MPALPISPDHALSVESLDLADHELNDQAHRGAKSVQRLAMQWQAESTAERDILRRLRQVARHHRIEPPPQRSLHENLNRFTDPLWWRRALRKRFRLVEHAAIVAGQVHRQASPCVSDKALKRAERDQRRLAELLASIEATNLTTGEVRRLDEIAANSLANPAHRRRAMMVRIKGVDQHAMARGAVGFLLTLTCPSRMHARHFSGQPNERYDGTSPRRAQAYLNSVWRRAMRKLEHQGITAYGLRTVEPHHDGCPHWHVITYVAPEHAKTLLDTLRGYALLDSPDEPGAAERRFDVVALDPAKGGGAAYAAKYVSKNIDGEGVGLNDETGKDGRDSAVRAVTWARRWGVRQFQFFKVPPITPTRELHRLEHIETDSQALQAAHQASRSNNYAEWLAACEAHALRFRVAYTEHCSSRYAGETTRRIEGVTATARDLPQPLALITRFDEWRIEPRKRDAAAGGKSSLGLESITARSVDSIEVFGVGDEQQPDWLASIEDIDNLQAPAGARRAPPAPAGNARRALPC